MAAGRPGRVGPAAGAAGAAAGAAAGIYIYKLLRFIMLLLVPSYTIRQAGVMLLLLF